MKETYYILKNENYRDGSPEGVSHLVYSKDISKIRNYLTQEIKGIIYEEINNNEVKWTINKNTEDEFIYWSPSGDWEYYYWISEEELEILD